jgi:hypothetical protein
MSEQSDQLRTQLIEPTTKDREIEVERVVQLSRIADALEAIEATGVYVYQQGTEDQDEAKEATPRRQG